MPKTTYTDSKGEVMQIAEMNNFHLVNALCKVSISTASEDPAVAGDAKELQSALKAEVLKRLAPPAQA